MQKWFRDCLNWMVGGLQWFFGLLAPDDKPAQGSILLWVLRGCFMAIVIGLATTASYHFLSLKDANRPKPISEAAANSQAWLAFLTILGIGFLVILTDVMIRDKQITTISAVYFGLLLGLLLGVILTSALEPFLFDLERLDSKDTTVVIERNLLKLFVTVLCCYVCISTLLQTKDEFRFIIPYVEFAREVKGNRPLLLDTSVIIDGRIADICETRFIDAVIIVPRFVLQELQAIADSSDKLKRNRGRRGLDMLKRMQANEKVELQMHDANIPELRNIQKVDERLVVLAKALGARVVTNDYNLNKIAQLQGVEVVNLNELANALKWVALPGEALIIKVVKPGEQIGQGVGYLDDGTMVVVEQGRSAIGQEVTVVVTSVHQTPAGRMIFGRIERPASPAVPSPGSGTSAPSNTGG